jgi:hypothetical protein
MMKNHNRAQSTGDASWYSFVPWFPNFKRIISTSYFFSQFVRICA